MNPYRFCYTGTTSKEILMATKTKKPKAPSDLTPQSSSAGTLVLQWLTYAFWGWFIGALTWLLGVLFTNAILGEAVNTVIPYAIAATIVLLPLAFICDFFYRKHEPLRKTGAAMVIMLIHAVIFALLAIGALILAVFTGLNSIINATDDSASVTSVIVYTAGSSAVLFGLAFLRTLNPFKQRLGAVIYGWGMLGLTLVLLTLAIVGPVMQSVSTRNDRTTEEAITLVSYGVQNYTMQHQKLPENLDQISVASDKAETLINEGKVEYIAEDTTETMSYPTTKTHHYQLCVVYDHEAKGAQYQDTYNDWDAEPGSDYKSYPQTTPHDAGRVCYKLFVSDSRG